jgi:hypothetical protein
LATNLLSKNQEIKIEKFMMTKSKKDLKIRVHDVSSRLVYQSWEILKKGG